MGTPMHEATVTEPPKAIEDDLGQVIVLVPTVQPHDRLRDVLAQNLAFCIALAAAADPRLHPEHLHAEAWRQLAERRRRV